MSERVELLRTVAGAMTVFFPVRGTWCFHCKSWMKRESPLTGHKSTCRVLGLHEGLVQMFDEADARIAHLESELEKAGGDYIDLTQKGDNSDGKLANGAYHRDMR